jgi:hypothetical protein
MDTSLLVSLIALGGTFVATYVAANTARKTREQTEKLVDLKSELDELVALHIADVQAGHNERLKKLEFEHADQVSRKAKEREADAATLGKLLNTLQPAEIVDFLRNHDFGGAFLRSEIKALGLFLFEASQPDREFLIPELETRRKDLVETGRRLSSLLGYKTHPGVGDANSVLPPDLVNRKRPDWVDENASELNEVATEFVAIFDELVRTARATLIA